MKNTKMKIIAFSLWGDNPRYTIGAIKNVLLSKEVYPSWTVRVYVAHDIDVEILKRLSGEGAEIAFRPRNSNFRGSLWRFEAADSDDVMLSRDCDSRVHKREAEAVEEWLGSDKDFHIMRDHRCHAVPILGGMWGCRNGLLKGITQWIKEYKDGDFYQIDQNFLREVIYPKVKSKACVHDEFFEKKKFPSPRIEGDFVGKPFDENDIHIK